MTRFGEILPLLINFAILWVYLVFRKKLAYPLEFLCSSDIEQIIEPSSHAGPSFYWKTSVHMSHEKSIIFSVPGCSFIFEMIQFAKVISGEVEKVPERLLL